MNKPIDSQVSKTPTKQAQQPPKGTASHNPPLSKATPNPQRPGEAQALNKDGQPQQKLAQGEAQAARQERNKS
ncbi:hypothetical protein AAFN46_02330 [Pseudomonas sp. CAU 1711]|uniref:hypothetical protein n=1 Tax=Pseudomonas sp. CAU 1711 TaxID=3140356 RepID=UPI0032611D71